MNWLSIDQHIAVCSDIRYILNQFGHTVTELSLSGHATIIGKTQSHIEMLDGDQWGVTIRERKFKEFADRYGKSLEKYDGFICCYPPIFSMLYKYIDKPIIIDIPIRYECGAENDHELWYEFNEYLRDGVDSGRITLIANSDYDKSYAELFVDRPVKWIPSLCEYTGTSYNPVKELFLYYHNVKLTDPSGRMIKKHNALQGGHNWQCIGEFKGCIHFPYNISTMSTFEQYTANIPLFFPSKDLLRKMWKNGDPVLTQISWLQQIPGALSGSRIKCNDSIKDPNLFDNEEAVFSWVNRSDFYDNISEKSMQFIQVFDDVNDVLDLNVHQLMAISNAMRKHNIKRKELIYKDWKEVLNRYEA